MRYAFTLRTSSIGNMANLTDWPQVVCPVSPMLNIHQNLRTAFIGMAQAYIQQRKPIPLPQAVEGDFVQMNANVCLKILLHNEIVDQGILRKSMGAMLSMSTSEVNRLLTLNMTSNPDTLMNALRHLGIAFDVKPINLRTG